MDHLNLFESLPEGFRFPENEIDFKLTSLTLTQAFVDYEYPIPSLPVSYVANMRVYHQLSDMWLHHAMHNGVVLTNEDYSAVMVLSPIENTCQIDASLLGSIYAQNGCEAADKNYVEILDFIGAEEKDLRFRENAVYIEAFAVQPLKQGQKLGSKLMRKLFEVCEQQKRDVVLFTNTEKNAAIYTHFGFETVKKSESKELNSATWFMVKKFE